MKLKNIDLTDPNGFYEPFVQAILGTGFIFDVANVQGLKCYIKLPNKDPQLFLSIDPYQRNENGDPSSLYSMVLGVFVGLGDLLKNSKLKLFDVTLDGNNLVFFVT